MLTVEYYDFEMSMLRRGKLVSIVMGKDNRAVAIVMVLKQKNESKGSAYGAKDGAKLLHEVPVSKLQVLGTEIPLIGDA